MSLPTIIVKDSITELSMVLISNMGGFAEIMNSHSILNENIIGLAIFHPETLQTPWCKFHYLSQ